MRPDRARIFGIWRTEDGARTLRIEPGADGKELWTDLLPTSSAEVTGETTNSSGDGEWGHTGRHKWVGEQSFWGKDGGLVADLVADDLLYYAYTDSKYSAGWALRRVSR